MPRSVFLSYRRRDSESITHRIAERLNDMFGRKTVRVDVDTLEYGDDFRAQIVQHVKASDVMLVVISQDWLSTLRDNWARGATDYVVLEIETAIQHGVVVIPIRIDDAPMPGEQDLPESIRPLAYCNGPSLSSGQDFRFHIQVLADRLVNEFGFRQRQSGGGQLGSNLALMAAGSTLGALGLATFVRDTEGGETLTIVAMVAGGVVLVRELLQIIFFRKPSRKIAPSREDAGRWRYLRGMLKNLDAGLFGGLAGGTIAGVVIATLYLAVPEWPEEAPTLLVFLEVTITGALIGSILGALSLILTDVFYIFGKGSFGRAIVLNHFTGGLLAGALTGMITGPVTVGYFGPYVDTRPFMPPTVLFAGLLAAAFTIIFAILMFRDRVFRWSLIKNVIVSMLICGAAMVALYVVGDRINLEQFMFDQTYNQDSGHTLMWGGLIYGGFSGLMLGVVIGLSRTLQFRDSKVFLASLEPLQEAAAA